jgi:hypothetical protein
MLVFRLFIFLLFFSGCYSPVGPEILGSHISCHRNNSYADDMWIFQVWIGHPEGLGESKDVNIYLYDAHGNRNIVSLTHSHDMLWESIVVEKDTLLECGRWYSIDIVAYDHDGYSDFKETYYQNRENI